ncbi:MAG: His/Gly/Thr/Pro-type tRNA ligase C-terminal domain-containing protein, partial [Acidaminococcaceae bacterium]
HRVVYGSIERFIGILTENYAGAFPVWLAPQQVRVLPISEKFQPYADQVKQQLFDLGIRIATDDRNEKIGYKIREAQMQKVPYMLIIGEQEAASGTVAVRSRSGGDLGVLALADFIAQLTQEIATKQ